MSFSVINGVAGITTNPPFGEAEGLSFSVLNGASSNRTNPTAGESESVTFSVLNGSAGTQSNSGMGEVESLTFSVLNGTAIINTNPHVGESESLTFSVQNGAPKASLAGQQAIVASRQRSPADDSFLRDRKRPRSRIRQRLSVLRTQPHRQASPDATAQPVEKTERKPSSGSASVPGGDSSPDTQPASDRRINHRRSRKEWFYVT